jgi:tRNA-guanine family transglycosylase
VADELLGYRLATIHNLTFAMDLMAKIREGIATGKLAEVRRAFEARYRA